MREYTFQEYLQFDESGICKNEYYQGEILAMPGGTIRHNALAMQLVLAFGNCTISESCTILSSDTRLYIPIAKISSYPDLMLLCEKVEYYQNRKDIILNPSLIVEVLSPSTEKYDRQVKLPAYLSIPSVKFVLLVDAQKPHIEVYSKNKHWEQHLYTEGTLPLMDCLLNIDKIYQNIKHLD